VTEAAAVSGATTRARSHPDPDPDRARAGPDPDRADAPDPDRADAPDPDRADAPGRPAARQQAAPTRGPRHAVARHAVSRPSLLPASAAALSAALGVLLVAAAYTAGRAGHAGSGWADRAYWAGQALIIVPAAVRLLGRRSLSSGDTVALVVVVTVAEYLVKICYSPAAFTFADELAHWRSTLNLMQTGKLFTVNYMLPISPRYPGLEEVTAALGSVTGLPVFVTGLIVAGVAHLLFVSVLYLLFREVSGSHRVGGVAVLYYASNPLFTSFDSMFVYQTLALAFFGLTLLTAWRLASPEASGQRAGWLVLGGLTILATVITHHVTSYVLVAILVLISLVAAVTGNWLMARWTAALAAASALAAGAWLFLAAPQTWSYLLPFAQATLHGLRVLLGGGHSSPAPAAVGPLGNQALSAAAVLVMSALLPVGWWCVWRRYRDHPWTVALAIASAGWYVIVAVRLTVADGSELAGRASTFVFVPAAYIAALAVAQLTGTAVRWKARTAAAAMLATVLLLMFDGLVNGWPPYWERLPGAHQVAGSERSVGPEEIATARWALSALGPGNRFATDVGSYPLLGSYGDQDPIRNVAYLYTTPAYGPAERSRAAAQQIRYLWVDRRLSQSLPAIGEYFPVDPRSGKYHHPLPAAGLSKYAHISAVSRIYDSGNIAVYDLNDGPQS
jgi:hypothetical protein